MIWNDLYLLFSNMGLPAGLCLIAGLVLCVIEIFNSFKGWFAAMGGALIFTAAVLRLINGGTAAMLFWLLFIVGLIITASYLIMIRLQRYTWLTKTPALETAAADEAVSESRDYYFLLGREGISLTELCPYGKISINNTEVKAVSKYGAVLAGARVKVIEVEGSRVIIAELDN